MGLAKITPSNSGMYRQGIVLVLTVTFAPYGDILASGGADQSGKVWDVQTGQCSKTLQGHVGTVWSMAFHLNGKELVTGGDDQAICLWQVKTGACLRTLRGYTSMVLSVAFCHSSTLLLSGGEDVCVRIWDIETGKLPQHTARTRVAHLVSHM